VGDAHAPRPEFAGGGIFAALQFHDDLDKGLLEKIVGLVLVSNDKEDIRIQL
jgi:hypothetical protein